MTGKIYIFNKMTPQEGYKKLQEKALPGATVQWLIRESRQFGMLTIDFIMRENTSKPWVPSSTRMALTDKGWIDANNPDDPTTKAALKSLNNLTAETAARHAESLQRHISLLMGGIFKSTNRINPASTNEQASAYSAYRADDSDEETQEEETPDAEIKFEKPFVDQTQARPEDIRKHNEAFRDEIKRTKENYYELIGLPRNATLEEILPQIKKMKIDAVKNDKRELVGKFSEAEKIFRDPELRSLYNAFHPDAGIEKRKKSPGSH